MTLGDFLQEKEFVDTIHGALTNILLLLLKKGVPFSVVTDITRVSFNPPLPEDIAKRFQPATLFDIYGYTLTSAKIEKGMLIFEAGFGENNFASFVNIPTGAVLQIFMDNNPLFINMSMEKTTNTPPAKKSESKKENITRSLKVLLNNPKNKKLLKK
ncbi:MAG: hypothetical protein LBS26_05785 [Campylobacteraceae bacterium]|jgi:hypothetical protein|nr:hypothetical protein [Campylobacteraceae bacterium]